MDCISKAVLFLWVCECIITSDSQIAEDVAIDCKVDCACCKNQRCGSGPAFTEGHCYDGCIDGYRGGRCYEKCTYNCTKCENDVNTCSECFNGYFLGPSSDCTAKCPIGCETCTSKTTCTKCKDEYYSANGFTDCRYRYCPQNCECQQNQCTSCKSGYYDISTSCSGICPGNCMACSSRNTCDVCREGYFNGHRFDNSNLPLSTNCTQECRDNCERCSSYNTCLQCKTGRYGSACQEQCSIGCATSECMIDSGSCKCSPKFSGDKCDQCQTGRYGTRCEKQCPHNCVNSCDIETGTCDSCINNFYGLFCNLSCSSICIDNVCNQDNGKCTRGCNGTTDDPVCHMRSDFLEEKQPVTAAVLGSFLAVSVVVNIVFIGRLLLKKIRTSRRKPMIPETGEAFYQNTGNTGNAIEMIGNTGTNGNDYTVTEPASLSVSISKKSEYEDIRNVQESEHEYGHISPAATN